MGERQYSPKRWWENLISTCQGMRLSSAQAFSHVQLFATPWTAARQTSCSSPTPGVYSNSCPLSWWFHLVISSSDVPFSSCLQSFPAPGSFSKSQLFASGGQSIEASASASVLPMNIQGLFPVGLTGLITLLFKGFSRVCCQWVWCIVFVNTNIFRLRYSLPPMFRYDLPYCHCPPQPSQRAATKQ